MIFGLTGTLGAGKGTVVEYLKSKGFAHYSSSETLKQILVERGLPLTRTHMSPLADELLREREGGVLAYSFDRAQKDEAKDFILEAIHREHEAEYVRSLGGIIIGVDAPLEVRYARTVLRKDGAKDDVTYEEFLEHAHNEDEGNGVTGSNIRAVIGQADVVIENNGSLAELHAQVDRVVAQFVGR